MLAPGEQRKQLSQVVFDISTTDLLVELLQTIKMQGYKFITPTPVTHSRYLSRVALAENLRDIFGWNLPFTLQTLPPLLQELMVEADLIQPAGDYVRSKIRIASLGVASPSVNPVGEDLFLHSSFPTTESNSVFFGPDTYRFARFIRQTLSGTKYPQQAENLPVRILDIGCGSGAGGVVTVRALPKRTRYQLTLNDINPLALDFAQANTQVASVSATFLAGNIFECIEGKFDLIVSNPPYMSDAAGRTYRDGGGHLGLQLSQRIVELAFEHLAPGGKLILYTGVAMTGAKDPFISDIAPLLASTKSSWHYEEIDPDIFSEELDRPAYKNAYRIAAVGLVVTRGEI